MKRIKYFFSDKFNLAFTLMSIFVLFDMKFHFLGKSTEKYESNMLNNFLSVFAIFMWVATFTILIVWSTINYNNKK